MDSMLYQKECNDNFKIVMSQNHMIKQVPPVNYIWKNPPPLLKNLSLYWWYNSFIQFIQSLVLPSPLCSQ